MREFAKIAPSFWTGKTGRALRGDPEALIVAMYLISGPQANMSGLYYLPIPTMAHETGLPLEGASKALQRVCEAGFAEFDESLDCVWVREMARFQVGESMKPGDKRISGIAKQAEHFRKSHLFFYFYERYRVPFCLPDPGEIEAPSKPLGKPLRSQEKEKEKERTNVESESDGPVLSLVPVPVLPRFDFAALYKGYPRKEGKKDGLAICQREITTDADYQRLGRAITKYAKLCKSEGRETRHIKLFDSFMSVWTDYADDETPAPSTGDPKYIDGYRVLDGGG